MSTLDQEGRRARLGHGLAGVWLATLGGTFYYLIFGVGLMLTGVLVPSPSARS